MGLISMRGWMVCFALYFWWIFYFFENGLRPKSPVLWINIFFRNLPPFLPAGGLALLFLGYHYYVTGWVGYHPNSPWAGSFQQVDFSGFIKNIGLLIWRLLDYGRFFCGEVYVGFFISIMPISILTKNRKVG